MGPVRQWLCDFRTRAFVTVLEKIFCDGTNYFVGGKQVVGTAARASSRKVNGPEFCSLTNRRLHLSANNC